MVASSSIGGSTPLTGSLVGLLVLASDAGQRQAELERRYGKTALGRPIISMDRRQLNIGDNLKDGIEFDD